MAGGDRKNANTALVAALAGGCTAEAAARQARLGKLERHAPARVCRVCRDWPSVQVGEISHEDAEYQAWKRPDCHRRPDLVRVYAGVDLEAV